MADISKITVGGTTYNIKDTKVTSVDNHYTPSANTKSTLSVGYGSLSSIERDAKGHVTGIRISDVITKLCLFNNDGAYDSVSKYMYELLQSQMPSAIAQGLTHFELTYKYQSQDAFTLLTEHASDDFTPCIRLWLKSISQDSLYKKAEYKLHFSFISPNGDDVKTITFNKITSLNSNGAVQCGSLNLASYIALGLANMGFSIEVVANKIGEDVYVHHNVTPFIAK